jgi:hypothetical protein
VSFFIGFNITHYSIKETCTESTVGVGSGWNGEYSYSPEDCEEKIKFDPGEGPIGINGRI